MGKCTSSQSKDTTEISTYRLKNNLEDSLPEIESATVSIRPLSGQSKLLITESLKKHYLFRGLSNEDMEVMFTKLKYYEVPPNSVIFEQGSKGKKFYIIEKGLAEAYRNNVKKNVLKPGETFGEMALLTDAARRGTLKTGEEQTSLWGIGREQFRAAVKVINKKNFTLNKSFLSNLKVFSSLTESQLIQLTESLVQHDYDEQHRVICEGDEGLMMFIIKEGKAVAKIKGVEKYRIGQGEMFGEAVVLGDNLIRKISVYAMSPLSVLSISRDIIISVMGENFKRKIYETQVKNSLNSDYYTRMFGPQMHLQIIEHMDFVSVKPGDVAIVKKSSEDSENKSQEEADLCKKSLEENVIVLCIGMLKGNDVEYSHSEVFGISMKNMKNVDQLVAGNEVVLGIIPKIRFESIYKAPWDKLKYEVKIMMLMSKVDLFSSMSLKNLKYISSHSYLQEFDSKEIIYKYNDEAYNMFIIKEGVVEISHNGKILRVMGKYDLFGDKCIYETIRSNTARALSGCVCVLINAADVQDLIDSNMRSIIKRKQTFLCTFNLNQVFMIKLISQSEYKFLFYCSINSVELMAGVVVIKKCFFDDVDKFNKLVQEKNIFLKMESRYILNLLKTFSDPKFVYLVYEYSESVPLSLILSKRTGEDFAKFIAACLTLIIQSFHDKDIIFRGISPMTININSEGYPIISELSNAKIIKGRTCSVVGDPLFMAPEINEKGGYTKNAELWSLGILIYLMLYGVHPFNIKPSDNFMAVCSKVKGGNLKFPNDTKSIRANEVVCELLNRDNPRERLSLQNLRTSRWLDSIDWERLINFSLESPLKPYVPKVSIQTKKNKNISLPRYLHENHVSDDGITKKSFKFNWDKYF